MVCTYNGILLSLKSNGILTQATIWINPEDIVLSEINQTQKDKHNVIPLT